jgi:hypothetical protein
MLPVINRSVRDARAQLQTGHQEIRAAASGLWSRQPEKYAGVIGQSGISLTQCYRLLARHTLEYLHKDHTEHVIGFAGRLRRRIAQTTRTKLLL